MNPVARIAESHGKDLPLAWLREIGYSTLFGPDIAPGEPEAERSVARNHPQTPSETSDSPAQSGYPTGCERDCPAKSPAPKFSLVSWQQSYVPQDARGWD